MLFRITPPSSVSFRAREAVAYQSPVEAVFASMRLSGIEHTSTHYERRNVLRNIRQYQKLWQHYRPLHDAASDARYLEAGEAFHMTPQQVESILLDHHLKEIIAFAQWHAGFGVP